MRTDAICSQLTRRKAVAYGPFTQFFMTLGQYTASEKWYCNDAIDLGTMMSRAQTVAKARRKMLGSGCDIPAIRVGTDQNPGITLEQPVDATGFPVFSDAPRGAWDGLMVRVQTPSGYRGQKQLAYVPASQFVGTKYTPDTDWGKLLINYVGALANAHFGLRVFDRGAVSNPAFAITNVVNTLGVLTITATGLVVPASRKVAIRNMHLSQGKLHGVHRVQSLGGGAFEVLDAIVPTTATWKGDGTARPFVYTVEAMDNYVPQRYSHRIRGGRVFLPRGRQQTKT
jgi:hypothetical protein